MAAPMRRVVKQNLIISKNFSMQTVFYRKKITSINSKNGTHENKQIPGKNFHEMMKIRTQQAERCHIMYHSKVRKLPHYLQYNIDVMSINHEFALVYCKTLQAYQKIRRDHRTPNCRAFPHLRHNEIPTAFKEQDAKNVDDQLTVLDNLLQESEQQVLTRFMVCAEMSKTLSEVVPGVVAVPHGSTLSGLGRKGSDLDVFVYNKTMDIKLNDCHKIKQHLVQSSSFYLKTVILHARVPILKCDHSATRLQCDVSLATRTTSQSEHADPQVCSEMLYTMGQIDSRFCSLVRIIKLWATSHRICREGLNTYPHAITWTLMALFYLQSRQSPLLPPVRDIYHPSGGSSVGATVKDIRNLTKRWPRHEASLGDLLKGFCDFYINFDFESTRISVNDGRSYCRDGEEKLGRRHKAMLIPLELSQCYNSNVSSNVSDASVKNVKLFLKKLLTTLDPPKSGHSKEHQGILQAIPEHVFQTRDTEMFKMKRHSNRKFKSRSAHVQFA